MLRGSCYVKSQFTETPRKRRCAAFVIDTSGAVFLFDDDLDRQLNEIPSYVRNLRTFALHVEPMRQLAREPRALGYLNISSSCFLLCVPERNSDFAALITWFKYACSMSALSIDIL
jgi:hypothetical protein